MSLSAFAYTTGGLFDSYSESESGSGSDSPPAAPRPPTSAPSTPAAPPAPPNPPPASASASKPSSPPSSTSKKRLLSPPSSPRAAKKPKPLDDEGYLSSGSSADGPPLDDASPAPGAAVGPAGRVSPRHRRRRARKLARSAKGSVARRALSGPTAALVGSLSDSDSDSDSSGGTVVGDPLVVARTASAAGAISSVRLALERASSTISNIRTSLSTPRPGSGAGPAFATTLADHPIPQIVVREDDPDFDVSRHMCLRLHVSAPGGATGSSVSIYLTATAPMRLVRLHAASVAHTHPYGVRLTYDGEPVADDATMESLHLDIGTLVDAEIDAGTEAWVRNGLLKRKRPSPIDVTVWKADAPFEGSRRIRLQTVLSTPLQNIAIVVAKHVGFDVETCILEAGGTFLAFEWPIYILESLATVEALVPTGKFKRGKPTPIPLVISLAAAPRTSLEVVPMAAPLIARNNVVIPPSLLTGASAPAPAVPDGSIVVQFRYKSDTVKLRFSATEPLGRILASARTKLSLHPSAGRFVFDGDDVLDTHTAEALDIEDMDLIDVVD